MNAANEHGSDAALLAATGAGDQTAFAALYDRYSHPAYRLAYLILGEREATETVVLMAFVRLWRVPGDYVAASVPVRAGFLADIRRLAMERKRAVASIDRRPTHGVGATSRAEDSATSHMR